jgi:two-component system, chemotaxis family, CheB/CheR fusion protein
MAATKTGNLPKRNSKDSRKEPGKSSQKPIEPHAGGAETGADYPIVGIGASAGGLEAFEQFFTNMPSENGMAFVLVQHLDPLHKSILSDLLGRYTTMKVMEVRDEIRVEPNKVFVIPPNRYMAIMHRKLHLLEPTETHGLRTPIDFFFRSLAEDQKEKAICIVLSGTGTEGALGLRAVKGEGGMAMVQDPASSKYDGMPRHALATGLADYVLTPQEMPGQLLAYVRHAIVQPPATVPNVKEGDLLEKVFILVRAQTGHDFSFYKKNTILRRIDRRMAVNQISRLRDYVSYLQENPREADTLFKELLIGVTSFFRDKEAFEALEEKGITKLFEDRAPDRPLRIWVPGCSTGEEAYSIAILCQDVMERLSKSIPVQIFATDIDNDAVEFARAGLYPDSIGVDVPQKYLDRFFKREDGFLRVKKEIRDTLVFALQNVITDPPFSRIDLISCRNLLIYFDTSLQKKVLPLFHYALNKDGLLFLGTSESIGEFTDTFHIVNRKWKLFRSKGGGSEFHGLGPYSRTVTDRRIEGQAAEAGRQVRKTSYRDLIESLIMRSYSPAGVLINEKNEVLYIHGRTGKYLEPAAGEASWNILAMAREGLKMELASAIRKAGIGRQPVRSQRLLVKSNGKDQLINLVVTPIEEPPEMKGLLTVLFEEIHAEPSPGRTDTGDDTQPPPSRGEIGQLERELRSTKEYLQTTIEELETSNEELKSTNEELQSSNEELQSTNEEMETSKEELQSVNEELRTVNSELQQKIEELSKASSDLSNLLSSTQIGTVFLDTNLNIQRFTPAVMDFVNLIQTDVGRPLAHIVSNLRYEHLVADAKDVLRTLAPKELEVQTQKGSWYSMRILPYRTVENVIDGVVVTFFDITTLKEAEAGAEKARLKAVGNERSFRQILDVVQNAVIHLDTAGRITYMNVLAQQFFGYKEVDILGRSFVTTLVPCEGVADPNMEKLVGDIISSPDKPVQRESDNIRKNGERVRMIWTYTAILGDDASVVGVMGLAREVTGPSEPRDP